MQATPYVNKAYILKHLDQEEIMEKYLDVPVQYDHMFKSPLRMDENPTCVFSFYDDKVWFRDWSMNHPLDIFSVVMEKYMCSFQEAIEYIAEDFNLKDSDTSRTVAIHGKSTKSKRGYRNSEKSKISVKLQGFTQTDADYLSSYGITKSTAKKFNVFSPKVVWLKGKIQYVYTKDNPALAYYFGKDDAGNGKWKIYFYKNRGEFRFLSNTSRINGWIQIPDVDNLLVITKSLKDVMSMYEFGLNAISMQGESTIPYDYIIDELRQRFDYMVTLYDYDDAGIRNAEKIEELYGIPSVFINEESLGIDPGEAKDFSDYVKFNDRNDVINLVNTIESAAYGNTSGTVRGEHPDIQQELSEEL